MKLLPRLALVLGLLFAFSAAADAACPGGPQPRPCDCKCDCQMACFAPCADSDGSTTTCGAWGVCSGQPPCPGGLAAGAVQADLSMVALTPAEQFAEWLNPLSRSGRAAFCSLAAPAPAARENATQ